MQLAARMPLPAENGPWAVQPDLGFRVVRSQTECRTSPPLTLLAVTHPNYLGFTNDGCGQAAALTAR